MTGTQLIIRGTDHFFIVFVRPVFDVTRLGLNQSLVGLTIFVSVC